LCRTQIYQIVRNNPNPPVTIPVIAFPLKGSFNENIPSNIAKTLKIYGNMSAIRVNKTIGEKMAIKITTDERIKKTIGKRNVINNNIEKIPKTIDVIANPFL
jgi:hypothetical protein